MAADTGLRSAIFGSTRARFNKIASIASGIPCPLILSEPKRAMTPTRSPPTIGTRTIQYPSELPAGDTLTELNR